MGGESDPGLADLVVEIADACVADCARGEAMLAVRVGNAGNACVAAGVPLAVHAAAYAGRSPR